MKIYQTLILLSFIIAISCKENNKKVETVPETVIESSELENYSEKFRKLMITDEGVLRGFTFITDSSEIKRNENATPLPLSSNPRAIAYTVEFNELEMSDVIYHLKGNEVDTFEVDLYLKNRESTDSLLTDFKNYFTSKYGTAIAQGDSLFYWKDSVKNVAVKLKDIKEEFDNGLSIYLYKNKEEGQVQ